MLEQLKKAQGKGKAIQKSSGEMEEEEKEKEEKVGTRIRLGLKPWGELKNFIYCIAIVIEIFFEKSK